MGIFDTLKQKAGPLPIWAWAGLGTVALAVYLIRKKSKTAQQTADQTAADQTNSNLGSAAELANQFEVAGLMPYQGGSVYVNTTSTAPNPPTGNPSTTPPVGKDIATSRFYKVPKTTDWDALAKQLGVFGGSGQALYQYNIIANKHTPATIAAFKKTPKTVTAGNLVAVPLTGVYINLPNVGVVKS